MRALYVSHTGMTEPLGRSQVMPYLFGLARAGWSIDLVGFEPEAASAADIANVTAMLADGGIKYSWTRRSASHALATKVTESARAFASLAARALLRRPRIIHARSYLPAAVAKAVSAISPGSRFLFDCRGLLGDEYVDFGHWSRDSFRYRLIKVAERQLFGRADAIVVLTDRLRQWLRHEMRIVDEMTPVEVIPCCVDLDRFRVDADVRMQSRAALAAGERLVVAYSGTLGAWYCEAEMAALFAAIRRRRPALFAVYTRSPTERLRAELRRCGVADEDILVQAAAQTEMPRLLSSADVGVSFAEPRFSKIASSPVKVAEYLAVGLPVVINDGVGDQNQLERAHPLSFINAGTMTATDLDRTADEIVAMPPLDHAARLRQREVAVRSFSLSAIGVERYQKLYERLAH